MKSLYEILTILETDISTDLPALLTTEGLDDFDIYKVGGSKNPNEMGFFIYQDNESFDFENDGLSIILQLQLYKKDELTSAKYWDVIKKYMIDYAPSKIGYDILKNITLEYWPTEQRSTSFIYVVLKYDIEIDSCG
jgi:hypothetical protein